MIKYRHDAWDMDIIINTVFKTWDRTDNDIGKLLRRLVNIRNEKHRRYKLMLTENERFIIIYHNMCHSGPHVINGGNWYPPGIDLTSCPVGAKLSANNTIV